jgi:hypothetical protein
MKASLAVAEMRNAARLVDAAGTTATRIAAAPSRKSFGLWECVAGLPGGRTALVGEFRQESDPSKLYAVLVGRAVRGCGGPARCRA